MVYCLTAMSVVEARCPWPASTIGRSASPPPRLHRPVRAGEDHARRRRPRGPLLAGHALPLLRQQAGSRAAHHGRRARTDHVDRVVDAARAESTFADAVVAAVTTARASSQPTRRCASSSSTSRRRCSPTSRSRPATACSPKSVMRSRPRSRAGSRRRRDPRRRLARARAAFLRLDARAHRRPH